MTELITDERGMRGITELIAHEGVTTFHELIKSVTLIDDEVTIAPISAWNFGGGQLSGVFVSPSSAVNSAIPLIPLSFVTL
jgi:hypothetical protein